MESIRRMSRWSPWQGGMRWSRWLIGRRRLRCRVAVMSDGSLTYRTSGVDRGAVAAALDAVQERIRGTFTTHVLGDIGHFAGLVRLSAVRDPVLVSSIDGVGTKVVLARQAGRMDVGGRDAITHGVNDVAVLGAVPRFALDYVAASQLDPADLAAVVSGMAVGCPAGKSGLRCGGAWPMPGVYTEAGLGVVAGAVGAAERAAPWDGPTIRAGDPGIGVGAHGWDPRGYPPVTAV